MLHFWHQEKQEKHPWQQIKIALHIFVIDVIGDPLIMD